ncbi:MAG: class I SAM-dependent methyltransferase [Chloroflexi bacterium]|nr:class I SAM-dependent methyltransferase [Chloroflexota bacterium]
MDILEYNRAAWDRNVDRGNVWTIPVDEDAIAAAKQGEPVVWLTDKTPVPPGWFAEIPGNDILCLASAGGQQAPLLAAAGYNVTSYDNSERMLAQDRLVAEREDLALRTVQGDMADLSVFADASFDLVFHAISNIFAPSVLPVWREAYRVLRPGGVLMAGFVNPLEFIFDLELLEKGEFVVKHTLPYSDTNSLSEDGLQHWLDEGVPLVFGHTLTDQIGGQIDAGFVITGFYEDRRLSDERNDGEVFLSEYTSIYIATRALKQAR